VSDPTITFLILAVAVAVFVWDRLPVGMVAVGTALSLWATGILDYEQVFAGFGGPTVIFIASLFVVGEGLDAAGLTSPPSSRSSSAPAPPWRKSLSVQPRTSSAPLPPERKSAPARLLRQSALTSSSSKYALPVFQSPLSLRGHITPITRLAPGARPLPKHNIDCDSSSQD
jgi:hypothetical protein